ncbi:dual specificity protein kinase yak1 [Pleurotus ostreatus]|uniref:Dual specificity protein kinase yak1 n=2 Tax=Pleurotus ostreatus TaxID=5322 RepID=A0A8H7DRP5_PLEOS|nr:dual specificity protein kinase yak1 [Pleurotus ostreatus]KAF7428224.1 dual specificity protein kinase yak1 [Pleurotus ostreatus]
MSEPELAYMTDSNESAFDLPRWQTHLDPVPSSIQAQPSYHYAQPPPPPPQSMTAGPAQRLPPIQHQASAGAVRQQPRISQLLEQDQQLGVNSPSYLSPTQSQLSRSASLGGGPGNSASASRGGRRHHQLEDLEGAFHGGTQTPSRQLSQPGPNSLYSSSVGYQPQSLAGTNPPPNPPTSMSADTYSDMYYTNPNEQPPKRAATTHDSSTSSRGGRSPLRSTNQSGPNALLDPYSPQQYSPSNSASYTTYASPPDQRNSQPTVYHARNQSQVKTEPSDPSFSPRTPMHATTAFPPSAYSMESGSPHPSSQSQSHLNTHTPARPTSISNPGTPMSAYHPSSSPYYQDQAMAVDAPSQRRRVGLRRIRDARELQPRVDVQPVGRRMGSDGTYLSPLRLLTTHIVDTYRICNPQFRYESTHNPRRVLTKPSKPVHNEGYDNEDYDYILYVNDCLGSDDGHKYLILDILGQGTFGQVVKCQNMKTHEIVAVKVVKNKPAYFNQSMMEVTILELLNKQCDPNDEHHILRLRDSFIHRSHLCLVFELLSSNLYELIKQNQFQGLSTQLVKVFMAQLLDALTVLKEARLIHCDLKPENILLKSLQSPEIKIIDFGSACHERQTIYTYIQSRFYRSPEVLLGMSYTASIDMWSLGCIAVELFLGLPLFPGTSEYNQLTRIVEMLGMPPLSMLNTGKQTNQFFDSFEAWNAHNNQNEKKYRLKTIEQYSREHNTNEQPGKQYFKATTLPDIINTAPMPTFKSSSRQGHEMEKELNNRASFIDFCQGLLNLNPVTRWTPQQARQHPFITGEKWAKPFVVRADLLSPPFVLIIPKPDGGHAVVQSMPSGAPDPKRPYGGLVPSQPKGTRAYQDAASYNQHLAQHQVYTAQAQAASQAASSYRNPYINPQTSQPAQSYVPSQDTNSQSYQQHSQYPNQSSHRALAHQNSTGQLTSSNTVPQYPPHPNNPASISAATHLNPNVRTNSQYPNSRARANTINQMDSIPPALARLQHMNQDVIAGRNALTPVLNRDDAMREWERRQTGKPAAAQPYPQLEYLQQQAELAAASGMAGWTPSAANRYVAPPSKLSHSYHPTIVVDDDRRDVVMSNVRSAARTDNPNVMYSGGGVISSPPQAYSSNAMTSGNRYPANYPPSQPQTTVPFDDRRPDIGNIYMPMQPDQYQSYNNASTSGVASRHVAPPQQAVPPSFYGAGVVPSGTNQPQRNPFSVADANQQPMSAGKDNRRSNGMDSWPR